MGTEAEREGESWKTTLCSSKEVFQQGRQEHGIKPWRRVRNENCPLALATPRELVTQESVVMGVEGWLVWV